MSATILSSNSTTNNFYSLSAPSPIEVKSGIFTIIGDSSPSVTSNDTITVDGGASATILPDFNNTISTTGFTSSGTLGSTYIVGNGGDVTDYVNMASYDASGNSSKTISSSTPSLSGSFGTLSLYGIQTDSINISSQITLSNLNIDNINLSTNDSGVSFADMISSDGTGNFIATDSNISSRVDDGSFKNITINHSYGNSLSLSVKIVDDFYIPSESILTYSNQLNLNTDSTSTSNSNGLDFYSTNMASTANINYAYQISLYGENSNININNSYQVSDFSKNGDIHINNSYQIALTSDYTNLWIANSYSIDNNSIDSEAQNGVVSPSISYDTVSVSSGQNLDISGSSYGFSVTGNYGNYTEDQNVQVSSITGNFDNLFSTSNYVNIDAGISGYGVVSDTLQNTTSTIYGNDASMTFSDNASVLKIDGTFKSLVLNNDTSDTAYVSVSNNAYINDTSSTINLTATTENSNIDIYGDDTNTYSILGNDAGTITDYTTADTKIVGTWQNFNGVVSKGTDVNISTVNANIYNNTTSTTSSTTNSSITALSITGTSDTGTLTYNGDGNATIVGEWGDVTATFGTGVDFNSIIGSDSSITLNTGVTSSIWNKSGTDVDINVNGGINNIAMGSGYTGLFVDMSTAISTTVSNFSNTHGEIVLSGVTQSDLSIAYNSGNAVITDTKSETTLTIAGATDITSKLSTDTSGNSTLLLSNNS